MPPSILPGMLMSQNTDDTQGLKFQGIGTSELYYPQCVTGTYFIEAECIVAKHSFCTVTTLAALHHFNEVINYVLIAVSLVPKGKNTTVR